MTRINNLADAIINKAIKEKSPTLNLGFCGLTSIPERVFKMTWLRELNLSNFIRKATNERHVAAQPDGSRNYIAEIPIAINKLKNLVSLSISGFDAEHYDIEQTNTEFLEIIPDEIDLPNLVSLDLSNNVLRNVQGINNLKKLQHLDLSFNKIEHLHFLPSLQQLKILTIKGNQLKEIDSLDNLRHLNTLNLSNNQITEIKNLDKLTQLTELNLSINQITEIKNLDKLININELRLSNNQIAEIKNLDKLSELETLYLGRNQIGEIKNLDKLFNLNKLDLSSNQIREIKNLDKLNKLNYLSLVQNSISEIKNLDKLSSLQTLDLSSNQIKEIEKLDKLSSLLSLSLTFNQITEIKNLSKLSKLNTLTLDRNQISEIKNLDKLSSLQTLYLSHNQIKEIEKLDMLSSLQTLYLSHNQIKEIEKLDKLSSLQTLSLSSNQIKEIKNLDKLSSLQSLNLSLNQIKEIKNLDKPSLLQSLDLSFNQIKEIENLEKLTVLKLLSLSGNQLTEIKNIEKINTLSSLGLSSNQITCIKNLDSLINLEFLDLSYNPIAELENINTLSKLNHLWLRKTKIGEIKNLDKQINLTNLQLESNQIAEIKNLNTLKNLKELSLGDNQLTEIKGLTQLKKLGELNLSGNNISAIKHINTLTQLITLNLSSNKINSASALKKTGIKVINLYNNPLKDVPQALLGTDTFDDCRTNLLNWWAETASKKNTRLNKLIKLQVLGNGNAGKSSIIEALKKGKCTKEFDSTHGVLVESIQFKAGKEESYFQAWDFGGQEIYHGTHKLFIGSESIMLMVTDYKSEQKADSNESIPDRITKEPVKNQPLEHYIELAKRQSPASIIVIAENKIDEAGRIKNYISKKVAVAGHSNFCEVSAHNGTGILTLRAMLAEKSHELLNYNMLMPRSWLDVQKYFMENLELPLQDRTKIISKEGFNTICNRYKVMERSRESLLTLLHHTGLVYANKNILKETIITDQRWALEAIYKPLERGSDFFNEMQDDYKGRVRVKRIFSAFGEQYRQDDKWLFIEFMQSCGLCFPLNVPDESRTMESYYVFPQFLPIDETPAVKEIWQSADNIKIYRRTLSYFDYSRIQLFINKIGQKTKLEYIWRHGIMVVTEKGKFRVEADRNCPAIKIQIEVSAESAYLLSILESFNELDDINKEQWYEIVDIDKTVAVDIQSLQKKYKEITFYQKDNNKSDLNNFDNRQEDETKNKLEDQLQNVPQERPKRLVVSYASEDSAALDALEMSLSNYIDDGKIELQYDNEVVGGRNSWSHDIETMFNEADGYILLVSQYYQYKQKKEYIWQKEIPIIEKRFNEEQTFAYCISVGPVDYHKQIKQIPPFKKGAVMPETGNARALFFLEFAREVIEKKFLKGK